MYRCGAWVLESRNDLHLTGSNLEYKLLAQIYVPPTSKTIIQESYHSNSDLMTPGVQ